MPDQQERRQWRALIYNRASSDKTGQGVSVDSQNTENRAWCDREGWQVAGVVTDNDRSATRFAVRDREGFRTVHDGLADGRWGRVDVLVSVASSRNQRRLDGYVELRSLCERHAMRLAYDGSVYDMTVKSDRLITGFHALLDESAAEDIRDGILRSHRASVAAGKPRGSIPFGYTREYNPGTRRMNRQVPDPRTAPIVEGIVADVLAGKTLYSIAQRLNRDEVPTPQAERDRRREVDVDRAGWSTTMIRNMLSKPTLAGFRTHHGSIVGPGNWEAIVPPADWHAIQALLSRGLSRATPGREVRHLLSGIAECAVCGAWMRPLTNRGRPTYICAGLTPTASKGHVHRSRPPLDSMVVGQVVERLRDPTALKRWEARSAGSESRVAALDREIDELETLLAGYVTAAGTRTGRSEAAVLALVDDLSAQIDAKEAERGQVSFRVPPSVLALAGPDAETRWNSEAVQTNMLLQRLAVRTLLRVQVHRVRDKGRQEFDESTVTITPR